MASVWECVRGLKGSTLTTLYRSKRFTVAAVDDDNAWVVPNDGNGSKRAIRRDRIEFIASLGLQRDKLRQRVLQEYPESRNASYIAAIVWAISKHVGGGGKA